MTEPLLDYQKELFFDTSRFIVIEKSRRVGITWVLAGRALYKRLNEKKDLWFVSANLETSKEFIIYCKAWAEVYNTLAGYDIIDIKTATTETLTMPNGSRIGVLSSNPTALRGLSGDVILDEFAFHEQQEALLTAAQPVTTWSEGSLILCSTHNGPATTFFNICLEASQGKNAYKHYKIDLPRAIKAGMALKVPGDHQNLLPDTEACNKAFYEFLKSTCVNDDAFKQEFLCQPLSMQSLITAEEYDAVALWDVPECLDLSANYRPLYVGVDIGRSSDATVVWIIEQYENPKATGNYDRYDYKTVCVKRIRNMALDQQIELISKLLGHSAVTFAFVDQGTVGRVVSDSLSDRFSGVVVPYAFTAHRKSTLAERLAGFVQYKRISVPKDEVNRSDFLSLRRLVGPAGGVQYDGYTKNGHCDAFWAAALAIDAAEQYTLNGATLV